jgi:hypothetical protein
MLNFSRITRLAAAVSLLAFGGCSTLPTYEPAATEKTVNVQLLGYGAPSMCVDGRKYRLDAKESAGAITTQIPVGQRVTLSRYMTYAGYQVTSSCNPSLSLIPKEGVGVILNTGLADGRCFIEVVREDRARDTGVALEPTVGPPAC